MKNLAMLLLVALLFIYGNNSAQNNLSYKIVDTGQEECYDTINTIPVPQQGDPFYGQDAQHQGFQPAYVDNGDGTITDLNTNLMWQKYLLDDKFTYSEALVAADTFSLAGYNDWRLPTIKELYSLIDFSGSTGMSASGSVPYINTDYFEFRYGGVLDPGERFIDAQYATSTEYQGTTMNNEQTMFGVNFADGRIKGYPQTKDFEVRYVRGNEEYGINDFFDNGDGTISDNTTGLMWSESGSENGMNWEDALAWVQQKNSENYLGYNDWRLPNAKELQSLVDYMRSPTATNSAAISSLFSVPEIIDEGGNINYPFYWTSTTHFDGPYPNKAVYIAFGEALGFMEIPPFSGNFVLMDVHGAGAQRSDPKSGDPNNYPNGFGPQGDVIRIFNYVRPVRDIESATDVGLNENKDTSPDGFTLLSNYPNPFNPSTTIEYRLFEAGNVELKVFDILGKEVTTLADSEQAAGNYKINWTPAGVASGIYIFYLKFGRKTQRIKGVFSK